MARKLENKQNQPIVLLIDELDLLLPRNQSCLARRLIFGSWGGRLGSETDAERKKIRKFKESAWKGVYFLSAEFLVLSVAYNEPWFTNIKKFWVGPGDQIWPDLRMKFKLKGVYMYAAGFYVYSIIALLFWETRRSDFGLLMPHHIASVFLIVMAYIFRYTMVLELVCSRSSKLPKQMDVCLMTSQCIRIKKQEAEIAWCPSLGVMLHISYLPLGCLCVMPTFLGNPKLKFQYWYSNLTIYSFIYGWSRVMPLTYRAAKRCTQCGSHTYNLFGWSRVMKLSRIIEAS